MVHIQQWGYLHKLKISRFSAIFGLFAILGILILPGCRDNNFPPTHQLTPDEKAVDIIQLSTMIARQYAPLDYKAKNRGKASGQEWLAELSQTYQARARATENNQEFIDLLREFISEFADAHMSIQFPRANLKGFVTISFLGFSGVRKGEHLLVTDIFPSSSQGTGHNRIEKDDLITHVDGMPIADYARKNLFKFRNLGNDLANLTMHMPAVVTRESTRNGIAPEGDVVLTVQRGETVFKKTLRWSHLDLNDFRLLQERSKQDLAAALERPIKQVVVRNKNKPNEPPVLIRFRDQFQRLVTLNPFLEEQASGGIRSRAIARYLEKARKWLATFRVPSEIVSLETETVEMGSPFLTGNEEENKPSPMDRLRAERYVPEDALPVPEAEVFPAYMQPVAVIGKDGKPTKNGKLVGYIRLDTFSPEAEEDAVLAQVAATLSRFQTMGVQDIVVDMLNNGGGSLSLLYKLTQLFSGKKLVNQKLAFGTMDTWYVDTRRDVEFSSTSEDDSARAFMIQINREIEAARSRHEPVTIPLAIERLLPGQLVPNPEIDPDHPFKMVVLVNEMCASAADMAAWTFKSNGMAVLVGAPTMGAGGNVVSAPDRAVSSHAKLNLTQSLVMTPEGHYVENHGAAVDVPLDHSEFVGSKYRGSVIAGFGILAREGLYEKIVAENKQNAATIEANVSECEKSM